MSRCGRFPSLLSMYFLISNRSLLSWDGSSEKPVTPSCGEKTIYEGYPKGDGMFLNSWEQRQLLLQFLLNDLPKNRHAKKDIFVEE